MARSSKSTQSRRTKGTAKAKPAPSKGTTAKAATASNIVVARRLAFLSDANRRKAAKAFTGGESLPKVIESVGGKTADGRELTTNRAAYAFRQAAVEAGLVKQINPDDVKAIQRASEGGEYADLAWLSCRTGLTPDRVKERLAAKA